MSEISTYRTRRAILSRLCLANTRSLMRDKSKNKFTSIFEASVAKDIQEGGEIVKSH